MTRKLLSLISGLMIMVLSLSSLVACDFAFGNTGSGQVITLNTNEAKVMASYNYYGDINDTNNYEITGSYDLFSVNNEKTGLSISFSLAENSFVNGGKLSIMAVGVFSNKSYKDKVDAIDTNTLTGLADVLEMTTMDIIVKNEKGNNGWVIPFNEGFFNNKIIIKSEYGNDAFELSKKYKEVVYKKIQIYLAKRDKAIDGKMIEQQARQKENEVFQNSIDEWASNYRKSLEGLYR